jgi:preprotein translocase subunit SecG
MIKIQKHSAVICTALIAFLLFSIIYGNINAAKADASDSKERKENQEQEDNEKNNDDEDNEDKEDIPLEFEVPIPFP